MKIKPVHYIICILLFFVIFIFNSLLILSKALVPEPLLMALYILSCLSFIIPFYYIKGSTENKNIANTVNSYAAIYSLNVFLSFFYPVNSIQLATTNMLTFIVLTVLSVYLLKTAFRYFAIALIATTLLKVLVPVLYAQHWPAAAELFPLLRYLICFPHLILLYRIFKDRDSTQEARVQ